MSAGSSTAAGSAWLAASSLARRRQHQVGAGAAAEPAAAPGQADQQDQLALAARLRAGGRGLGTVSRRSCGARALAVETYGVPGSTDARAAGRGPLSPALPVAGHQARELAVKKWLTRAACAARSADLARQGLPRARASAARNPGAGRLCGGWHESCNRRLARQGQESMESTAYIALSRQMVLGRQHGGDRQQHRQRHRERLQGRGAAARAGGGRCRPAPAARLRPGHRHGARPRRGPDDRHRQPARPRDRGAGLFHDRDRRKASATAAAASSASTRWASW